MWRKEIRRRCLSRGATDRRTKNREMDLIVCHVGFGVVGFYVVGFDVVGFDVAVLIGNSRQS